MPMFDLMSQKAPVVSIAPVSVSDNTAQVGAVIDGFGFDSLTYVIAVGSLADADATFAVLLEESDQAGSGFAAVADADLIGTEALAGFQFDDDNECRMLGYKGSKRYTRLTVTPAGNSGAALLSAIALREAPWRAPTANPPA